jgi:AcrR family transcriptional regulator
MKRARGQTKRLPPDQRRALIEDAAAKLFAERGYAATKLEDIAAMAGVTKPVLYRHFKSKKDLHLALLAKHRDGLLGQISANVTGDSPLATQLPAILDAWFAYVEEHPYAWKLLFRDTTGDPEIQAFHQELHASARNLTASLIESREEIVFPPEEIEPLAELIRSATTGLALWWLEHPEIPRSVVVAAVRRTLEGLLSNRQNR